MTDFSPLPVLDDLTDRERELIDAARSGTTLVVSELPADQLAEDDDPDHAVRADLLRELLLGRRGPLDPRGVRLSGARIAGPLDLDDTVINIPLSLAKCSLAEGISATSAHLHSLHLPDCCIATLAADDLKVDNRLFLASARVTGAGQDGAIRLFGAHVGGQLDLSDAEITNGTGPALFADGLTVDIGLFLTSVRVVGSGQDGAVRLPGAHIGGQLDLSDAEIINGTGPALIADGLTVDSVLFLKAVRMTGFGQDGALRLLAAHIGGGLDLCDAEIVNIAGPALYADGLKVDGNLSLMSAQVAGSGQIGALRLPGAHVGGQLDFEDAEVTSDTGVTLRLDDVTVGTTVFFPAEVMCSASRMRTACADPRLVRLDGFTFGALAYVEWQQWLHLIRHHTKVYRPGPYQVLAAAERAAGHDGNARRILIAQQQDLYARAPEAIGGWWTRRFHWLWGALAGYGFLVRRTAAALLLTLVVAGGLGLWAGRITDGTHHIAERIATFTAATGQPCTAVELIGVGLDRGLPLSPSGVRNRCDLNPDTDWGWVFTVAIWIVQAAVWGLATLALAGYTGLIRKTG